MKRNLLLFIAVVVITAEVSALGSHSSDADPVPFKSQTCHSDFGSYPVSDGTQADVMAAFLRSHIPNLQNKQTPLVLTFSQVSPGGYHYTFRQTYAGIPVYASEITVNVSRKNVVYSIFDDSYDISSWHVNTSGFNYQNVPAYQAFIKQYFTGEVSSTATQMVAFDATQGMPVLCYLVTTRDGSDHVRDALVARDRVVYQHDDLMYHHRAAPVAPDSAVTILVNNPDPLTTAHVFYYGYYMGHDSAFQNFNDSCTVQLDTQRWVKTMPVDFSGGTFNLSSHYIQLANPEGLGYTPAFSDTPCFNLLRCDERFEDAMVYYHLNTIRSYVHGLGFNSADTPMTADPNHFTQDNSFFSPPNLVVYGTGGVPDAQDADVIVHEYTHFISWNSNQSNTGASERGSIDEGSADYDASSYSASIDTFAWYNMFTWDGHNEYWPGRLVNDRTVYPALPTQPGLQGIYVYSVIWSSALMQIWWDIGRGPADSLFFQTLYGLGPNITLPDAAQQYIASDSLLFGGQYHCIIVRDLNAHGLAPWDSSCHDFPLGVADIAADPNVRLLTYPDGFQVVPAQPDMAVSTDLYDMTGRRLSTYTNVTQEIKPDVPDGVYIVEVSAQGYQRGFKWVQVK